MWAISGQAATCAVEIARARRVVPVVSSQGRGGRGDAVRLARGGKPAVLRLAKDELLRLLPWSGCGERLAVEVGDVEACTARVALSLVACALMYGISIELASVAGFYWAWAPILGTAVPSILLRSRYGYAGVWSAQVLDVQVLNPPNFIPDERTDLLGKVFNRLPTSPSTLMLEIGDGSPATFRMELPLSDDLPVVEAGDRVELVVVSDEPSLSRFKVLRDLYFPEREAWISEKPCIERVPFEQFHRSLGSSAPSSLNKGRESGILPKPVAEDYPFTAAQSTPKKERDSGRRTQPLPKENTLTPAQSSKSKGGDSGTPAQQLIEENTLSRDRVSWEKALRRDKQSSSRPQKDFDYVPDGQEEKKYRRRARELNDDDLYL